MDKRKAALLSVFSNSILIIFKLAAGIFMGSISVISEAIHSSIDLLASFIAFFSIRKAAEAEDKEHPFGHGKYENISGFVEALLIFVAAALIIYEAIKKIIEGAQIESTGAGIIVMLVSSVVNLIISMMLLKIAKKTDSIALEADGMHLLTDVATSFGVFIGLIIVRFTGLKIVDPITALFVAVLIIKASYDLTKKSMVDLLDSSLPEDEIDKITKIIASYPEVKNYHRLRTRKNGQKREIDIHIRLDKDMPLTEAHDLCHAIKNDVLAEFKEAYIIIQLEPFREETIQIEGKN
ncbi:cation diffusion facilitator family transporter [Candidatus Clostridium stratigraminis]|uniref:Cation diffusion facilitator family transporter n=1 Tax=Candidatus Clostridium stratigraminis TaxID=3381661 RepID=A0ABW8T9J3_9CLOT